MTKADLNSIFSIEPNSNAPQLIVYSEKISSRLIYCLDFVFHAILNLNYKVVTDQNEFEKAVGLKINYSNDTLTNSFKIAPHSFLFEEGITNSYTPQFGIKRNLSIIFENVKSCDLGYDIFSGVFYFISRYQEWQPCQMDNHNRFELKESIQFKNMCHLQPLVNLWVEDLKLKLECRVTTIKFPPKKFININTIDVDNLFAYKGKGVYRTVGAFAKDILRFDFSNLKNRFMVVFGNSKDPFDVYSELASLSNKFQSKLFFFFLFRADTKYDRTVNPKSSYFSKVISKLKENAISVGIHPSYYSSSDPVLLNKEMLYFKTHASVDCKISRQHYLRFNIKSTPQLLLKKGMIADFTMGFSSGIGYRASTFTPFYYYDFESELQTDLLLVPFVAMDGAYFIYSKASVDKVETELIALQEEAKKLNGVFITVFHERTFDASIAPGFKEIYTKLLQNSIRVN